MTSGCIANERAIAQPLPLAARQLAGVASGHVPEAPRVDQHQRRRRGQLAIVGWKSIADRAEQKTPVRQRKGL